MTDKSSKKANLVFSVQQYAAFYHLQNAYFWHFQKRTLYKNKYSLYKQTYTQVSPWLEYSLQKKNIELS